jgi:hypothetical protein
MQSTGLIRKTGNMRPNHENDERAVIEEEYIRRLRRRGYVVIKVGTVPEWMIRTNIVDIKYPETYAIGYGEEPEPHCPLPECSCKGEHDHNYS